MGAVENRGCDGCCHKANDDEEGAADASIGFGVGVRVEDLVEEGGDGIEEADVDAVGDENKDSGWVREEQPEGG